MALSLSLVIMLKSYFKVALRSFSRNKLVTFINIFGLGLAMTIGMIVLIRMQFELGFDTFHPERNNIFRITTEFERKSGEKWKMATTSLPLRQHIEEHFQDVKAVLNIYPAISSKVTTMGKELYLHAAFTDPHFFDVFGFRLKAGSRHTSLKEPNSIVLSKATAERFFGTEDPINQKIILENEEPLIVTGVLEEPAGKSQLNYDAYVSSSSIPMMENNGTLDPKSNDWFSFNAAYTFVLLPSGIGASGLAYELEQLSKDLDKRNTEGKVSFKTQALSKINPSWRELSNEMPGVSPWTKIIVEIGVALLILAAACFNYTNLTIARAMTRAKEVGVRKVSGAGRWDVFVQYIVEAIALSLLALAFAWFIMVFIIRFAPFNDGYEFIPSAFRYSLSFFVKTFLFALAAGLFAGLVPAWILSAFKPLRVLKNLSTAKIGGKINLQKTLIVFQYSLSLTIIIFLLTFYKQFSFMGSAEPGYKKDNVVVIALNGIKAELAKQKITEVAGVQSAGAMSGALSKRFNGMTHVVWLKEPKDGIRLNYYFADAAFMKGMDFQFKAGSNFSVNPGDDNSDIIINEEAAKSLGFRSDAEALGQRIWINDSTRWQIRAVINNFSYENLAIPVRPIAFRTAPESYNFVYAVVEPGVDKSSIPNNIQAALKSIAPSYKTMPTWFEDDIEQSYSQSATISLLGYLAFMATAIASLGLLGLVIHHIQTRRKEISIRKIIGASERQLILLLSRRFVKLLLVAGVIAVPLGYIMSHLFLRNFVNRIQDTLLWPLLCFVFLLGIGLATIISQTYKAATANPGKDLRTE